MTKDYAQEKIREIALITCSLHLTFVHWYIKLRESANLHAHSYGKSYSIRKMKTTRDAHTITSVSVRLYLPCEENRLSVEIRKDLILREIVFLQNSLIHLAILICKKMSLEYSVQFINIYIISHYYCTIFFFFFLEDI